MYGGTSGICFQCGITLREDIMRYIYLVRVKTSITLPSELISQLDRVDKNRSALLERAARAYLARLESDDRDRRDVEIINRNAERLNREATDTLEYQQMP
jgi:metal-responsive CopG/Arc/MetJ family transcriptional regulator